MPASDLDGRQAHSFLGKGHLELRAHLAHSRSELLLGLKDVSALSFC